MTTISSDVIRGYNDTFILYLLLDRPSYGYEISRMIRSLSEEKYVIKETTLYSAFTRMEKNGFITSFLPECGERQAPHILQHNRCGKRVLQGKVRGVECDQGRGREVHFSDGNSRTADRQRQIERRRHGNDQKLSECDVCRSS